MTERLAQSFDVEGGLAVTGLTELGESDRSRLRSRFGEILTVAALFVFVLGFYSLNWRYTLSDEMYNMVGGVSTIGAERVLAGEIPYRDFWTMYAPGHFYLLAALFRIFGTDLWVEVVAASVVSAAAACVCYWLVVNLVGRRPVALACAAIFVAAMYNTGYVNRLGSYPPAILLIFVTLSLMVYHYKTEKPGYLVAAGLTTGMLAVFKHDVGGYTAIAVVAGLIMYHLPALVKTPNRHGLLLSRLYIYSAGVAVIALPTAIYFAVLAGPDMLQDLVIFPLTDFPFARPETYPGLLPFGIYDPSAIIMLHKLTNYVNFTIPFGLFLLGLAATARAVFKRRLDYAALGATFSVAFLLHYRAAHVQINTHIVTMSVYAAWLGVIFGDMVVYRHPRMRPTLARLIVLALVTGWLLSLLAKPAYRSWELRQHATAELNLPRVSGFMVTPEVARTFTDMLGFVNIQLRPDEKLFVGLHRHDIVIIGDTMIYFLFDRPQATRYQELHPAITDAAPGQQEIIADLQKQNVRLLILKRIFPDEHLEQVKERHRKNLPYIGATDLDEFIRANYAKVRDFGPYAVWMRKGQ